MGALVAIGWIWRNRDGIFSKRDKGTSDDRRRTIKGPRPARISHFLEVAKQGASTSRQIARELEQIEQLMSDELKRIASTTRTTLAAIERLEEMLRQMSDDLKARD